jgi:two-component system response regulator FlrC
LLIPALRQRPEDVVALARHFLATHGGMVGRVGMVLSVTAEMALRSHAWPGNVRELENVIQRAMILTPGDTVEVEHLHLMASPAGISANAPVPVASPLILQPAPLEKSEVLRADSIRDLEREHILETLAAVGGSRKAAIERLGISERTLRYKLKQYKEEGFFHE